MKPNIAVTILPDRSSYLPGSVISGQVALEVGENVHIERASVNLSQIERARTRFLGFTTGSSKQIHYILTQHILRPRSPSHSPIILIKGVTRLPFSLKLPSSAPPSFVVDDDNFCKAALSFSIEISDNQEFHWEKKLVILPNFIPLASYNTVTQEKCVRLFLKPVHAAFDKNYNLLAEWSIENRSSSNVGEVQLSMHKKIVMRTERGTVKQFSETLYKKDLIQGYIGSQAQKSGCINIDLNSLEGLTYSVPSSSPILDRLNSKCIVTKYITIDYILRLMIMHRGQKVKLKVPVFILPLNVTPLPKSPTLLISQLKSKLSTSELQLQQAQQLAVLHETEIERLMEKLSRPADDGLCCICLEKDASVVFVPCGHLCICKRCNDSLTRRNCPICRHRIENAYFVYK